MHRPTEKAFFNHISNNLCKDIKINNLQRFYPTFCRLSRISTFQAHFILPNVQVAKNVNCTRKMAEAKTVEADFKSASTVLCLNCCLSQLVTPTSRTWCANQLRYIPIEKINLPLSKFIDIDCQTALQIRSLVLVDQADLCELVNHRVDLGSVLLCCRLVGGVAQVANRIPCCFCIIPVMQSVPFVLAIGFLC